MLALLCALPAAAAAEDLPDPTKPPTEISAPAGQAATPKDSGLQSIIISSTRRAAIINGETVELGGKHGDATLVEVSEGRVVLQGAQGKQVLTLFPGVEIKKNEPPKDTEEKPAAQKSKPANKKTAKNKKSAGRADSPARLPQQNEGEGR